MMSLPWGNRAWFLSAQQQEVHGITHQNLSYYSKASSCHTIKIKSWKKVTLALCLVGGENNQTNYKLSKETFTAKGNLSSSGSPGKESDRTLWSPCTRQRSRLLSGEMKHPSETTWGLWVTRHWHPLADKAWPSLVAFQRHMSSGVFWSELQPWRRSLLFRL